MRRRGKIFIAFLALALIGVAAQAAEVTDRRRPIEPAPIAEDRKAVGLELDRPLDTRDVYMLVLEVSYDGGKSWDVLCSTRGRGGAIYRIERDGSKTLEPKTRIDCPVKATRNRWVKGHVENLRGGPSGAATIR